LGDKILN